MKEEKKRRAGGEAGGTEAPGCSTAQTPNTNIRKMDNIPSNDQARVRTSGRTTRNSEMSASFLPGGHLVKPGER